MNTSKLSLRPNVISQWQSQPVRSLAPRFIGFDDMFNLFDKLIEGTQQMTVNNYPPRNIFKIDENVWEVQFAVAGFSREELSIVVEGNELVVKGTKAENQESETKKPILLGIGLRNFEHTITIPDDAIVTPSLELGLLKILIEKPKIEPSQKRLEIL